MIDRLLGDVTTPFELQNFQNAKRDVICKEVIMTYFKA
jgi:hypothetical protein